MPWYERVLRSAKSIVVRRRLAYRFVAVLFVLLIAHASLRYYLHELNTRTLLINMSEEEWEMIENYDLIANLDLFENGTDA